MIQMIVMMTTTITTMVTVVMMLLSTTPNSQSVNSTFLSSSQYSLPSTHPKQQFSGFYGPPRKETFAGAYLISVNHFFSHETITSINNTLPNQIENAVFSFTIMGNPINLMTRDYFDFQVIHLSSTLNQLPDEALQNKGVLEELLFRMNQTVHIFQSHRDYIDKNRYNNRQGNEKYSKRRKATIVIIPYTSIPGTFSLNPSDRDNLLFNLQIRLLYLQATVLSIYRYFHRIIVTFSVIEDMIAVKDLGLPIWKYIDLSNRITDKTLLPKESLLYLYHRLKLVQEEQDSIQDPEDTGVWKNTRYVYYTEMDQILYARSLGHIYNIIDRMSENITIIPHRMQTIALPKSFHGFYELWSKSFSQMKQRLLLDVYTVIEDYTKLISSCCDSGRFQFPNCGNWWYHCSDYGIVNYTTWIRFGENGYTLPLGTEHAAKCEYSSKRKLCPIPHDCIKRIPRSPQEICDEMEG